MLPRVYLAGPDVFLPDAGARVHAMKAVCERHGLIGLSPVDLAAGQPGDAGAHAIAARNEAAIRRSDAVLANVTPFRGPSADPGTVYEIGFARALGRPVFGYATVAADYASRVRAFSGSHSHWDGDGLLIEDFGLSENLMISCGIEASGGLTVAVDADRWSLHVFELCAARAASVLRRVLHPAG